jgi:tetratricopeptide (TPR) repeat protein
VGVSRYGTTESAQEPARGRVAMPALPDAGAIMPGTPGGGGDSSAPIPPEIMARMLQAARQALMDGQYQQAIAAYQAVLKRDSQNVDAMTHLGLIVAIGGHADAALETFDKALKIDPKYAPAFLYRGQVLYEVKRDYAGAIKALERYVALAPPGEDRQSAAALIEEARAKSKSPAQPATPPGASR